MLTRSQVAKRLGRSIATVRRMEGHELFPTKDERGVHRFDAEEVAKVARCGGVRARSTERGAPEERDEILELRREQAEEQSFVDWQRELAARRQRLADQQQERSERERVRELEADKARQRAELEEQELAQVCESLLSELESLTPRQLASLGEEHFEELTELLSELEDE